MRLRKNKKIIITVVIIVILMLASGCTCNDDNYSDDYVANMERCQQSLEDGSAYEIDEALTAKAPWKVGDIIASTGNGMGEYYVRKFLGITKAGYYLVQDFMSLDRKKHISGAKNTDPFLFMSRCDVTNMNKIGISSICGPFASYYSGTPETPLMEQGLYLAGAKHGEWLKYYSDDSLRAKKKYFKGKSDGLGIDYHNNYQPSLITCHDNGRRRFQIKFEIDGSLNILIDEPDAFVTYDENNQTIRHGYWRNGVKAGLWRTWDTQGVLLEEIDYNYNLQP